MEGLLSQSKVEDKIHHHEDVSSIKGVVIVYVVVQVFSHPLLRDVLWKWDFCCACILQVMDAADEVIDSIDKDELAKFFSLKSDPEDEETEVCIRVANFPPSLWFPFGQNF